MSRDNIIKYLYCQIRKLRQEIDSIISGGGEPIIHLVGASDTPQIQVGDGAGIGATAIINGDDLGGSIEVNTGTSPQEGGVIVQVVFAVPYDTTPYIIISDVHDNYAIGVTSVVKVTNATNTWFEISVKSGITLDSENYKWNYIIKQ